MPDSDTQVMIARRRTARSTICSTSESATEGIGHALGERVGRGLCISLSGALGVGKSVLARGICRGLGVEESVLSPTFILHEEYEGRRAVVHLDLYRLDHESEIEALGVFDRLGGDAVVLVEWGDRSQQITARADIVLHLKSTGETGRVIEVFCRDELAGLFEGM